MRRGHTDRVATALDQMGAAPRAVEPVRGLRDLPAIGLDELNTSAALQDRIDVKYIVTLVQLEALLERIAPTYRARWRSTGDARSPTTRRTTTPTLDFGGVRLAAGLAIVESKSARGRAAIDRVLVAIGARPVNGCSKYLLGTALAHSGVRDNDLRPLLRRYFTTAPS